MSSAVVELEEIDDIGACWGFQIDAREVLFVTGQDYYETPRFPCDDFETVTMFDESGRPTVSLRRDRGRRLQPIRTVSTATQEQLGIHQPEAFERRRGRVEAVEELLTQR